MTKRPADDGGDRSSKKPKGHHEGWDADASVLSMSQLFNQRKRVNQDRYAADVWYLFTDKTAPQDVEDLRLRWLEARNMTWQEVHEFRAWVTGPKKCHTSRIAQGLEAVKELTEHLENMSENNVLRSKNEILLFDYLTLWAIRSATTETKPTSISDVVKVRADFWPTFDNLAARIQMARSATKAPQLKVQPAQVSHAKTPQAKTQTVPEVASDTIDLDSHRVDPATVKSIESIGGTSDAKKAFERIAKLQKNFPHLLSKRGSNILLHGPPGTGKTTIALSLAKCGLPTFLISSSSIVDKWQGSSERNLRAVFVSADKVAPAVLVIDEIDSLCARRKGNQEGIQRMTAELLICMSQYQRIILVGTTKLPWRLDAAFLRRFQETILVVRPGPVERCDVLRGMLKEESHEVLDEELEALAEACEGYSGDTLGRLVARAAKKAFDKVLDAIGFDKIVYNGEDRYVPNDKGTLGINDIPDKTLVMPPPIKVGLLEEAMKSTGAYVIVEDEGEQRHIEWSQKNFLSDD